MITPRTEDAIHKAWLYRVLTAIADDIELVQVLRFKGGTCAALLDRLDRFSVDLDFDLLATSEAANRSEYIHWVRERLEWHFTELGLTTKDHSKRGIQYFLRYEAPPNQRNTIKIECAFPPPQANRYAAERIVDIDRTLFCQTVETMFANKLVALLDRWERQESIAGRDIYDIHHFFLQGYRYDSAVIIERRDTSVQEYLVECITFIERRVTDALLQQDLNPLLDYRVFQRLQKTLRSEVLVQLRDELRRLG